jgi:hypothetical protein
VGGRDKPQIVIPFGPSPIDTPIPGSKIRKKPARDPEAGKGKPAERYLDAFVAALEAEGRTITRPRTSEGAQLGRIAAAHAKRDGHPITGAALIGWIGDITRRFVRAVERPEVHRGGISVFGLQTWLDNQRPGDADPEDDDVPPGEPVPPAVPRLPPVTFTREELRPALQQVLEVANRGRAARGLAPMTLAEVEAAGSS